jgi:glyoxylase-like metal-dependent hydrolase (beta-lactamase superfamily II)
MHNHWPTYVAPQVSYLFDKLVNVVFIGSRGAGDRQWVLVDAGLPGSAHKIKRAAASFFGEASRPASIILTHGHADHIGAIHTLAHEWDVPVYAHEMELPYLTGRSSYPPQDPLVGGGAMPFASLLFPRGPIDLGTHVHALPADGSIPGLNDWRWLATPGHTPGHVSLVRDRDRTLIAGDAFVTTKQESLGAVLSQRVELHGPPKYFTPDWDSARTSVRLLAEYGPHIAITGHGRPMQGLELQRSLRRLAANFDMLARPTRGRYHDEPAVADLSGVVHVPPAVSGNNALALAGAGLAIGLAIAVLTSRRGDDDEAALEPAVADAAA